MFKLYQIMSKIWTKLESEQSDFSIELICILSIFSEMKGKEMKTKENMRNKKIQCDTKIIRKEFNDIKCDKNDVKTIKK